MQVTACRATGVMGPALEASADRITHCIRMLFYQLSKRLDSLDGDRFVVPLI